MNRFSDPPVVAIDSHATNAPFAEFMGGTLPRWAVVRNGMDPTEIEDQTAAVTAALQPVADSVQPGARVCLAVELGEIRPGVRVFIGRNALEGADVIVPGSSRRSPSTPSRRSTSRSASRSSRTA
jgi:hypothetical protein